MVHGAYRDGCSRRIVQFDRNAGPDSRNLVAGRLCHLHTSSERSYCTSSPPCSRNIRQQLGQVLGAHRPGPVYHTKVLSGTKKERNQWFLCVFKGIPGQRYYESDYWPDLVPIYWLYKRPRQILVERKKGISELHLFGRAALLWRIYWLL